MWDRWAELITEQNSWFYYIVETLLIYYCVTTYQESMCIQLLRYFFFVQVSLLCSLFVHCACSHNALHGYWKFFLFCRFRIYTILFRWNIKRHNKIIIRMVSHKMCRVCMYVGWHVQIGCYYQCTIRRSYPPQRGRGLLPWCMYGAPWVG